MDRAGEPDELDPPKLTPTPRRTWSRGGEKSPPIGIPVPRRHAASPFSDGEGDSMMMFPPQDGDFPLDGNPRLLDSPRSLPDMKLISSSPDTLPLNGAPPSTSMESDMPVIRIGSLEMPSRLAKEPAKKKAPPKPPVAQKIPHLVKTPFEEYIDEYHWFRDKANPKVMEYLESENTYAEAIMKNTEDLQTTLYNEFCSRSLDADAEVPIRVDNYYYYKRTEPDKQYTVHCRKFDSLDASEEVVFDENEWAEGEDYFELGVFEVAPNHNIVALGTNTTGDERFTVYFKDLGTGSLLDDEIPNVNTLRWANDNSSVLYTVIHPTTGRSYRLYRHRLGTPVAEDELMHSEDDEAFVLSISMTNSGKFFLLRLADQSTAEVRFMDADDPKGYFRVLYPREPNIAYFVEHHGNKFFVLTNDDGAVNFKLVQVPVISPQKKNWREVLASNEQVLLEQMFVYKHHLVLFCLRDTHRVIKIMDLSDGEWHTVEFGERLTSVWPGNYDDEDIRMITAYKTNKIRFLKSSFLDPATYYDYDMDNRAKTKRKTDTVLGGYVPAIYHQERIFATGHDGVEIPISLVFRKDMRDPENGNYCLMEAYGAYGGNKHPRFDPHKLSLLDRGFVYAIAHVRGSGMRGRQWYLQGKVFNKKNTFYDFISCAKHLVSAGYTRHERLAIYGRSAGGLLMGAVLNMAPELFKVAVVEVPFVDCINTMIDPSIPWVAFEYSEWGDPRSSREMYDYMKSYSPYDNVKPQNYPHILITTGWNDPRVQYWEPTKWTARLRAVKEDSNILLLRTHIAGHMGSTGRYDHLEDLAFNYAFVIDRLEVQRHITVAQPLVKVVPPTALAPVDLIRMFQGFQITMALHAALELGLFDHLARAGRASCDALAEAVNCSERGTRILADALVAAGLLELIDGDYTNSEVAATHLVRGLANYIGDVRNYLVNDFMWDAIRRLPEAVRDGGPKRPAEAEAEGGPGVALSHMQQHWENVARYNTVQSASVGQQVTSLLAPWAARHKPLHVLDVGCGAGFLGFSVLQRHAHARLWSLDWPSIISIARGYAEQLQLSERVTFIEGDLFLTPLGGPYDLIVLGQVLHQLSEEQCNLFLRRILTVLKPSGRVVIHETVSGLDDGSSSIHPSLFSLSMLVQAPEGEAYPLSWYQRVLSDAGFAPPSLHHLQGAGEKLLVTSSNLIPLRARRYGKERDSRR